ncbi:MAG: sensor histidine kinase [Micromonosporaceae bacterium]
MRQVGHQHPFRRDYTWNRSANVLKAAPTVAISGGPLGCTRTPTSGHNSPDVGGRYQKAFSSGGVAYHGGRTGEPASCARRGSRPDLADGRVTGAVALAFPDMTISERLRRGVGVAPIALALLVLVIQLAGATIAGHDFGPRPGGGHPAQWGPPGPDINQGRDAPDWFGYLLLAIGPIALIARRAFPAPVLLITVFSTGAYLLLGYVYGPVFIAMVVALLSAIWHGARLAAWIVAGSAMAGYLALERLIGPSDTDPTLGNMITGFTWLLIVLLIGEGIRIRRERRAEAARAQQREARRQADEERLRIARELHDVLAHNISMINIQAGVALHLSEELPEQARTALQAIKDASRDTLRELRATLGVLRRVDEGAPLAPAPSLQRLDELLARAEAPGLTVRKEVIGTPAPLPAGVDLAAYRIIQEALTNVHRHAAAKTVTIMLEHTEAALIVTVTDDGVGGQPGAEGAGAGIAGMTERAAVLGGSLRAGRQPTGGFQVRATLPLHAQDRAPDSRDAAPADPHDGDPAGSRSEADR